MAGPVRGRYGQDRALRAHVSSGGIYSDRPDRSSGDAVRFTQSPRWQWPTAHAPEDLARFRERRAEAIGSVVCHALYLCNLAAPATRFTGSPGRAGATTEVAVAIESEGVIFHPGSHLGAGFETGLDRLAPALAQALELTTERTWLLLENTAGAGGTIGRSTGELAAIVDRLDRHPRLGLCLDSAHLYASGVDSGDPAALDAALDELDRLVGLDRLRALHVNDSAAPLGSNRDRHASIGEGLIGERLGVFLSHPALQHLPALLETPGPEGHGPDGEELKRLRALHRRGVRKRR